MHIRRYLSVNQFVVYHHSHTRTPAHYQLYLHFYIYYIHILLVLDVKPFVQDIFTRCDLISKVQDLVPVQAFIGLTACGLLYLPYCVVWHCRFNHCDTL